jgi:hypothetical protein
MSLNADTELRFDDGDLEANSKVLSFFISVLCNAVEAHSAGDVNSSTSTSNSSSTNIVIPMEGVTKQQWLAVAPFWHPVNPAPVIKTWAEAELLLRIGSRFELHPALDKARDYLTANMDKLTPSPLFGGTSVFGSTSTSSFNPFGAPAGSTVTFTLGTPAPATSCFGASSSAGRPMADSCVWKWLLIADELCLSSCIPALIEKAIAIDRPGCRSLTNTQGLSAPVLQQLIAELA